MAWTVDLSGKTAIVTGGATGIGAETCRQLASAGAKVAVNHYPGERDRNALPKVLDDIKKMGGEAQAFECDVSDSSGVRAMVTEIVKQWGRIDILVNNAMFGVMEKCTEIKEETFNRMMNVNIGGAFFCSQACLPYMVKQGGGSIIMMSSSAFENGGGGSCLYPATKGGMEGLMKGLVSEYARYNIRINAIRPAVIDTEIMRARYSEEEWNNYISKMPMGKAGTPKDIADAVVFLSDYEHASYINGVALEVDGARIHFLRP